MRVLYIESSPRKGRSHSSKVAQAFLEAYRKAHPDHKIDVLDLWKEDLPPFDGASINAKYAVIHKKNPTDEEKVAWERVTEMANRFKTADKLIMTVPMWNFAIPYRLKHYIDIITQPGLTFTMKKEGGYLGLVPDIPVTVIYSSGGQYRPGTDGESADYQKPYLRMWLNYVGLKNINELVDDGTMSSNSPQIEEDVISKAVKLAEKF